MILENIHNDVPCREKEVELLVNLLGEQDEPLPSSIFVAGHKSSGKSYTVTRVLTHQNIQHAIISCIEAYTPSLLFDPILKQFTGRNSNETYSEDSLIGIKCEDMMEFIQQLNNKAVEDEKLKNQKHVIVLEEAEYLRDMSPNILPAFLKLRDLTFLKNICVILVSTLTWEKFCPSGGISVPMQIYFPQYTQNELQKILLRDRPDNYPEEFYKKFLDLFLSIFLRYCRDLRELRYKATVNFSKYCEPIESGKANLNDLNLLWHLIRPHLKASLEVIYMRTEMEHARSESNQPSVGTGVAKESDLGDHVKTLSKSTLFALSFELPFYSKYLLIAAYLASYNAPKEDKKMFVKLSGRKKKQMPKKNKNSVNKWTLQITGPRAFDISRLLAIFYAITEEKSALPVNLLSQISTLVELQLLHRVGDDPLENPKFKCAVGFDFIIIIAKTLDFNVTKYLAEYQ